MNTKTCFKCARALPRTEFYRHPEMADGLLGKCKECTRVDSQKVRLAKIDKYRGYDCDRAKLPHRREQRRVKQIRKRKAIGPDYDKSHNAVTRAVANGTLIVPDHCSRCLIPCRPQAHHDDYSKPMDVLWLCPICHAARHVELGRIKKLTFLPKE